MEMVGPGPGGQGAHWVALRVPDGTICGLRQPGPHRHLPRGRSRRTACTPTGHGASSPRTTAGTTRPTAPSAGAEAFHPATPQKLRYTATRVWSLFRRARPVAGARRRLPPRRRGRRALPPVDQARREADRGRRLRPHARPLRGHAVGHDPGRGRRSLRHPLRCRPMGWEVDGEAYTWERPISTQQTGFSMVSQSRAWLPDPVGGLTWYGVDDTDFTCYVPLYCGIDATPAQLRHRQPGRSSAGTRPGGCSTSCPTTPS